MNKFKVGDRVSVYSAVDFGAYYTVVRVKEDCLVCTFDGDSDDECADEYEFHYKQCRRLVKKSKSYHRLRLG